MGNTDSSAPLFGELLKQMREASGLSQADLATRAGVSLRTIQGWEQGQRSPVSPDFFKVVNVLGRDPREFEHATARQHGGKREPKKKPKPRGRPRRPA